MCPIFPLLKLESLGEIFFHFYLMACSIIIYFSSNGREHGPFALCVAVKSWSLDVHFVLFTSTILREKAVVVSDDITKHLLKSRTLFSFHTRCVSWSSEQKKTYTTVAFKSQRLPTGWNRDFWNAAARAFYLFIFLNKEAAAFQILLCSNLRQEMIWWWML